MNKKITMFLVLIFLFSCTSSEKKIEKVKEVKKEVAVKKPKRKLFIMGDMNNWRKGLRLVEREKNKFVGKSLFEAGTYKFKICNKDESKFFLVGSEKSNFIEEGKEYTLKIMDKDNGSLNVFYSEERTKYNIILETDDNIENVKFTIKRKKEKEEFLEGGKMLNWRSNKAKMEILEDNNGLRTYKQSTSAILRDETPQKREFSELESQIITRTGNDMFDGLFAMAMEEARENSVEYINDYSFNGGKPLKYSAFETGEKWHYIWTRDLSYAVDLSLAHIDPKRAMNSLLFKVSEKREKVANGINSGMEIVQDTGSGGSWPVSSDRVTWAVGATEVLKYLSGKDYDEFFETSYEAMKNTIENDRFAVYDKKDGLYRGEQSFLDWREQTYPTWTSEDTVYIGMSKTLSTNALHYNIIETVSKMAMKKGEKELGKKYALWAEELKESINREFWIEEKSMYSTMKIKAGEDRVLNMYDMLGESLCILFDIADNERAKKIIANYPNTEAGVPVIWPQLPGLPIYHNRGIWPFVSAYAIKAAKIAGNDKFLNHNVMSLYRLAAINLSNMENYDAVSGLHTFQDGINSAGPVVNSKRQLWSVGGYISMVVDTIFGISVEDETLLINPYISSYIFEEMFKESKVLELKNFNYKGKIVNLEIIKPEKIEAGAVYTLESIVEDGNLVSNEIKYSELKAMNKFVVKLNKIEKDSSEMKVFKLKDHRVIDAEEQRELFTPNEIEIKSLKEINGNVEIKIDLPKNKNVVVNLYRNGEKIQSGLREELIIDKNISKTLGKTQVFSVEDGTLNTGNKIVETKYGKTYIKLWGAIEDVLTLESVKAKYSGEHQIRVVYANSHNSVNTGITSCNKYMEIRDKLSGEVIKRQIVFMPHLSNWRIWGESSIVTANLEEGKEYEIIMKDYYNMSYFDHFKLYSNDGGKEVKNTANIAAIKIVPPTNYYAVEAEYKDSGNQSHQSEVK